MRSRRDFQEARRRAVTGEEARDNHPDEIGIGAKHPDGPEAPDSELSKPLGNGTYLNDCQVSEETHVSVCAAVMDGKAVGVKVATSPPDPEKERCVSGRVRTLEFPSNPRLRVVRTASEPEPSSPKLSAQNSSTLGGFGHFDALGTPSLAASPSASPPSASIDFRKAASGLPRRPREVASLFRAESSNDRLRAQEEARPSPATRPPPSDDGVRSRDRLRRERSFGSR